MAPAPAAAPTYPSQRFSRLMALFAASAVLDDAGRTLAQTSLATPKRATRQFVFRALGAVQATRSSTVWPVAYRCANSRCQPSCQIVCIRPLDSIELPNIEMETRRLALLAGKNYSNAKTGRKASLIINVAAMPSEVRHDKA